MKLNLLKTVSVKSDHHNVHISCIWEWRAGPAPNGPIRHNRLPPSSSVPSFHQDEAETSVWLKFCKYFDVKSFYQTNTIEVSSRCCWSSSSLWVIWTVGEEQPVSSELASVFQWIDAFRWLFYYCLALFHSLHLLFPLLTRFLWSVQLDIVTLCLPLNNAAQKRWKLSSWTVKIGLMQFYLLDIFELLSAVLRDADCFCSVD